DRRRSPLMWFPGYQGLETAAFVGDYYLSGDTVELNEDGSISFVGRADEADAAVFVEFDGIAAQVVVADEGCGFQALVAGKPHQRRTPP
ncbi:AMP-binding protein, partial [Pseudomonas aeruginosa]